MQRVEEEDARQPKKWRSDRSDRCRADMLWGGNGSQMMSDRRTEMCVRETKNSGITEKTENGASPTLYVCLCVCVTARETQ